MIWDVSVGPEAELQSLSRTRQEKFDWQNTAYLMFVIGQMFA
jgi:hypothetical protein